MTAPRQMAVQLGHVRDDFFGRRGWDLADNLRARSSALQNLDSVGLLVEILVEIPASSEASDKNCVLAKKSQYTKIILR